MNRSPEKQDNENILLDDLLSTVLRGDAYDQDTLIIGMNDYFDGVGCDVPARVDLCYRATAAMIAHPKPDAGHRPFEVLFGAITTETLRYSLKTGAYTLLDGVLKDRKTSRADYDDIIDDIACGHFWNATVEACAFGGRDVLDGCKAAVVTLAKAKNGAAARRVYPALESRVSQCRRDVMPPPLIAAGIGLVALFAVSHDDAVAQRAKHYVRNYFRAHPRAADDEGAARLLAPALALI